VDLHPGFTTNLYDNLVLPDTYHNDTLWEESKGSTLLRLAFGTFSLWEKWLNKHSPESEDLSPNVLLPAGMMAKVVHEPMKMLLHMGTTIIRRLNIIICVPTTRVRLAA
jgi:hypothetical protein